MSHRKVLHYYWINIKVTSSITHNGDEETIEPAGMHTTNKKMNKKEKKRKERKLEKGVRRGGGWR